MSDSSQVKQVEFYLDDADTRPTVLTAHLEPKEGGGVFICRVL